MASKTYTIKLGTLMQNGLACAKPTVTLIGYPGIELNCIDKVTNKYTFQLKKEAATQCFQFEVNCPSCADCSSQIVEKCLCTSQTDCDNCSTCGSDGMCAPKCKYPYACDPTNGQCYNSSDPCKECGSHEHCFGDRICVTGGDGCRMCIVPPGMYEDPNGNSVNCLTSEHCGDCRNCLGGDCYEKDCGTNYCLPNTEQCVECLVNSHCGEFRECNAKNECEVASGYIEEVTTEVTTGTNGETIPVGTPTGVIVPIPANYCQTNADCGDCLDCQEYNAAIQGGSCLPKTCPTGTVAVHNGTDCNCYPTCTTTADCNGVQDSCVAHPTMTGVSYCHTCECVDCVAGQSCGPVNDPNACISNGTDCFPNHCNGTCDQNQTLDQYIAGGDCGAGSSDPCGCSNNRCISCENLAADACSSALGCHLVNGQCVSNISECRPEEAVFSLEKVFETVTYNNAGSGCNEAAFNGTHLATSTGTFSHGGSIYTDTTFNFSVSNLSGTGTWFYDSGTSQVEIGTGSSITVATSQTPINGNLNYFQVYLQENGGCNRRITFEAYSERGTNAQNLSWDTTVLSSTGGTFGSNASGSYQIARNYLCLTSTQFVYQDFFQAIEVETGELNGFNNIGVQFGAPTVVNGKQCVEILLSGCGTWQGKIPLRCHDDVVYVDTPVINTAGCCEDGSCVGIGTPCEEPRQEELTLIADPLMDGSNGYLVRIDADKSFFRSTFRCQNAFVWNTGPYSEGGFIYDTAQTNHPNLNESGNEQFTYVNFGDAGGVCVSLSIPTCFYCLEYTAEICINECTNLDTHVEETEETYRIYTSANITNGSINDHFPNLPTGLVYQFIDTGNVQYLEIQKDSMYDSISGLTFTNNTNSGDCTVTIDPLNDSTGCNDLSVSIVDQLNADGSLCFYVNGGQPNTGSPTSNFTTNGNCAAPNTPTSPTNCAEASLHTPTDVGCHDSNCGSNLVNFNFNLNERQGILCGSCCTGVSFTRYLRSYISGTTPPTYFSSTRDCSSSLVYSYPQAYTCQDLKVGDVIVAEWYYSDLDTGSCTVTDSLPIGIYTSNYTVRAADLACCGTDTGNPSNTNPYTVNVTVNGFSVSASYVGNGKYVVQNVAPGSLVVVNATDVNGCTESDDGSPINPPCNETRSVDDICAGAGLACGTTVDVCNNIVDCGDCTDCSLNQPTFNITQN